MEKKNIGLIVLVIILFLLVLGLGGFIVYDKVLSNNEIENNENNNSEVDNNQNESKLLSNEEALAEGKRLYDKANDIYETWVLIPYCGLTRGEAKGDRVETLGDAGLGNGDYFKSNFTSFEELKKYLKQWLSDDIVNEKVVKTSESNGKIHYNYVEDLSLLSKRDDLYLYVDYVLKDNTLYCRLTTGMGWRTLYQDKYEIKVDSIEENKITYTITSAYGKEEVGCYLGMLDVEPCGEEDLVYKDTKFVIEKNVSGNFVVSEFTLHD